MKAVIDTRSKKFKINRHVYGHFSEHLGRCIYDGGYWAGEDSDIPNVRGIRTDIVEAMKAINVPNIRWPGGCFADDYHWMDGIGPMSGRRPIVNVHWGGGVESNHFGTHEFMDLCEQIGCEPYICGNVGSGTVQEMRNWVEYLTDDGASPMAELRRKNGRDKAWGITMFGVGNENWGCGGFMTAQQYAEEYRKYATYVRNYKVMGKENWWQSPELIKIAGGANEDNVEWTKTLMKSIPLQLMGGLSVHCYIKAGEDNAGTGFSDESWYQAAVNTYAKETPLRQNISVMDSYDPDKKVLMALDEWGMWVDNEPGTPPGFLYQQNTMRSAMSAVLMLHMFHRYADRIRLANLAQTINVLQAILLTEGGKMVKTPTYHVFDMLKGHQDADYIEPQWEREPVTIQKDLPQLDISSSVKDGKLTISAANLSIEKEAALDLEILGAKPVSASGSFMAGKPADHNTFAVPEKLKTADLGGIAIKDSTLSAVIPACSCASLTVTLE